MKHSNDMPSDDDKLVELLASLRSEPTYPDDFEDRFLDEFHHRTSSQVVKQTSRSLLWEHICTYLQNFSAWKWAYGGMAACTAFIVGAIMLSSGDSGNQEIFNPANNAVRYPVSQDQSVMIIERRNPDRNQQNKENEKEQKEKLPPATRQLIEF